MLLAIAIGLALVYALLKPLSDGLFDTSMWVAKILAPVDAGENESTKQFLKFGQAALMEGWLSNVPFITNIIFVSSITIAFFYQWWAAILLYFVAVTFSVFMKLLFGRSVAHYLSFLYHKMLNRTVDYRRKNDLERAEAAESYCKDLQQIMLLYREVGLRPPTPKQLKDIPYGDVQHWLNANTAP